MITITRPLALYGTNYETSVPPNTVADMDGDKLIGNIDKTKCYIKFEANRNTSYRMYMNLIADGTIEYFASFNTYSTVVLVDRALLYTFLTINHGNGLRSHYGFYLNPYSARGATVRKKDNSDITTSSIGTSVSDYIQFPSNVNDRLAFHIAIEKNGVFINPREHLEKPSLIPPIVRTAHEHHQEIKPQLLYKWFIEPFNFTSQLEMVGNPENVFQVGNHRMVNMDGKPLIIKKEFWDRIPENMRDIVKIQWNGTASVINGKLFVISVYFGAESYLTYEFRTTDNTNKGLGVDLSAYPHMTYDEIENTVYTYENSKGKDIEIGKFLTGTQAVFETYYNSQYTTGDKGGLYSPINMTSSEVKLWPLSEPPIDPPDPPDPPEPPFVPDNGEKPDDGGGNQNWGQGNGTTDTEGGDFNNDSDEIKDGTGNSFKGGQVFNNYHVLDISEVLQVKNKVWGMTFPGLTRPSEAIISLIAYPFSMTGRIHSSESDVIEIGNSFMQMNEDVWILNAHYNNVLDFGDIKLEPYFGGFQDYSPYTKISIYLPFVGERDLDPTYLQGKTLNLKYYINFTDGSCIAVLSSDGVIYKKFNGIVGQSIPLTQVDNNLLEATISTSLQAAATVAVPGAGMAAVAGVSSASIMNVANSKPSISSSAGRGGETELSLPLQAFLTIERMHCAIAQTFNQEVGRPSMVNKKLSNCKGFTKMLDPQIKTLSTSIENDMINNMLKEGVIINE